MTTKKYKKYDIWLVDYAFDDNPDKSKKRPVLILSINPLNLLVLKITSQGPRDLNDYKIIKYREAGLNELSYIRMLHRLQIEENELIEKIGELQEMDVLMMSLKLAKL